MTTQQVLDKQGLQHYATKMCNAENRKVGSKSLPTALNDIDIAIDGFKTLFDNEYGTPVTATINNDSNSFTVGTGNGVNKQSEVENSFTDITVEGNTLINLCKKHEPINIKYSTTDKAYFQTRVNLLQPLIPSIEYTVILKVSKNNGADRALSSIIFGQGDGDNWSCRIFYNNFSNNLKGTGVFKGKITTNKRLNETNYTWITLIGENVNIDSTIEDIMILEGDWVNKAIPYFEGIKSIADNESNKITITSTGKNLLNYKNNTGTILTYSHGYPYESNNSSIKNVGDRYKLLDNGFYYKTTNNCNNSGIGFYIKCEKNTTYSLSANVKFNGSYAIKCQGVYVSEIPINNTIERSLLLDCDDYTISNFKKSFNSLNYDYLFFYFGGAWVSNATNFKEMEFTNIQLEANSSPTSYEVYKENKKEILLNEPLRGIGDIKDTIEKVNGEWKIVRRCAGIVFNGSESNLIFSYNFEDCFRFRTNSNNFLPYAHAVSDKFKFGSTQLNNPWNFCIGSSGNFEFNIPKTQVNNNNNVEEFKKWLQTNPTKIVYELETPIIEDIDPITLQCWKDGTISIDEILPVESTHTVALNKTAQIQSNIEELTSLRNRVQKIEEQYNSTVLTQAYETILLNFDMNL